VLKVNVSRWLFGVRYIFDSISPIVYRFTHYLTQFEKEMKGAFAQMQQVFQDPEMLSGAVDMMKNMQEAMTNPEKAMKELAATMKGALDDDVKIEEARLELIKDPNNAGNPMLAQLFADEEMKEILYDSEKWRAAVKEGQGMLLNDAVLGGAAGAGARVGEL